MNKVYKIGLLYYDDKNLGDVVIHDSCKYLIDKILKDKKIKYEIIDGDIGDKHMDILTLSRFQKLLNKVFGRIYSILHRRIFKNSILFRHKHWNYMKHHQYLTKIVFPKIKDCDLLIFAGGGLIKFHRQKFSYVIDDITKYADKLNIPVIFNACGVEGYDESNPKCLILKKAINRDCVKAISTRDDIDLLKEKYVEKDIPTYLVADSAVYSKETYDIKKKDNSNIIGICPIRPEIFGGYMYDVEEEVLLKMFSETITKLKDKGYQVELFTHGAQMDQEFIWKIKEYMNADDSFDKMVIEKPEDAKKLVELESKYKIVIGARLHSNIIPYSLGIPIVGIVWNNKQIMFSKINNIEDYFITKDNFNSDYLVKKTLDSINQEKIKESYRKTVYDYLEKFLNEFLKGE